MYRRSFALIGFPGAGVRDSALAGVARQATNTTTYWNLQFEAAAKISSSRERQAKSEV
jgi:hypothetical protein